MEPLGGMKTNSNARPLWSQWLPVPTINSSRFHGIRVDDLPQFMYEIRDASEADLSVLTTQTVSGALPTLIAWSGAPEGAANPSKVEDLMEQFAGTAEADTSGTLRFGGTDWHILRVVVPDPCGGSLAVMTFIYAPHHAAAAVKAESLRPLIAAYLRLWHRARNERSDTAAWRGALDALDTGVILLDGAARIFFSNRAADRWIAAGEPLRRNGASLGAADLRDSLSLQVAIRHCIDVNLAGTAAGTDRCGAVLLALTSNDQARALVLSILPLEEPARAGEAAVVAYIVEPDFDSSLQLNAVCRLFGLSPVESSLACHLAIGKSLRDAAREMHIKEQTARSYLKQIFLKTDTRRQAGLVRALLCSLVRVAGGISSQCVR